MHCPAYLLPLSLCLCCVPLACTTSSPNSRDADTISIPSFSAPSFVAYFRVEGMAQGPTGGT